MKKVITTSLICFLVLITFSAKAVKVKGYYIDNNNNKVEVTFKMPIISVYTMNPDYATIQKGIKVIDQNKKKYKITPQMAKEIVLLHNKEEIRMVVKTVKNKQKFLKQLEFGKMNLYAYYKKSFVPMLAAGPLSPGLNAVSAMPIQTKSVFVEKETDKLIKITKKEFNKKAAALFSDCEAVVNKIQTKEYEYKQMRTATVEYNTKCQ